ncbi:MAG TPA: zinc-binding alcohol dehydrogenase family protein [Chthonomonadaceae bacterium]|nr:zinc-binding alcohol dehydrogenase family protein [Chthonomonadaceae bacterium]
MLQAVLQEPGCFAVRTVPMPERNAEEALVRVRRIGVCGTDLHAFRGRQPFFSYPRVLGHELSGEIVEIGPNERGLEVGDRVAIEPYVACGTCRPCRTGRYNCCARLEVLGVHRDGGMQEWLCVPVTRLHASRSLSLEQLALIETLGIGYHAVERGGPAEGEWVVVVGAGPIGLAVMQFALVAGAQVIAIDRIPSRLAFCRRLGVEYTVEATGDVVAAVEALTGPELAHCVFDATGSLESMGASLNLCGPGGRVVMVGLAQGSFSVEDPLFHRREITLLASRNSAEAFQAIIRLMEGGRMDTSPWITHRLPLAALPEQFPRLLEPDSGVVKAMIETD